jgi:hypothetical protein
MSRGDPKADCVELSFAQPVSLPEAAEVALEDYARTLTRAERAETFAAGARVGGVHVCRPLEPLTQVLRRDVEDFACELARSAEGGGGLGWS